jgi:hypothetical protein
MYLNTFSKLPPLTQTDRQKTKTPRKFKIRFCDKSTKGKFITARFEVATTVLMTIQVFGMLYHAD